MKRIEAVKAWGVERKVKHPYLVCLGTSDALASLNRPNGYGNEIECKPLRVRVLREADYQRLLKAAKANGAP